jgi:hypothetical protein
VDAMKAILVLVSSAIVVRIDECASCVCVRFRAPADCQRTASLALTDWLIDAGTTPLRYQGISREYEDG